MIFVSVGTHYQEFNRLIRPMDSLAAKINEEVIIQRGASTYQPVHARHFQWTTSADMEELVQTARVVVAHAAAGISILVLKSGRPLVVVPRLKELDEMVDDHQKQLAVALASAGKATLVNNPTVEALRQAIAAAQPPDLESGGRRRLVGALREQLQTWSM